MLLALLLLALPSELTLQKLLELPELGDRSHQLLALQIQRALSLSVLPVAVGVGLHDG